MRLFTLFGAVVVVGMSAAAGAATPTAEAMVPVRAFIDSFNKGDMKAAAAQTLPTGTEETHCVGATPKADGPGDPAARLLLTPIASATIAERSTGERHG